MKSRNFWRALSAAIFPCQFLRAVKWNLCTVASPNRRSKDPKSAANPPNTRWIWRLRLRGRFKWANKSESWRIETGKFKLWSARYHHPHQSWSVGHIGLERRFVSTAERGSFWYTPGNIFILQSGPRNSGAQLLLACKISGRKIF